MQKTIVKILKTRMTLTQIRSIVGIPTDQLLPMLWTLVEEGKIERSMNEDGRFAYKVQPQPTNSWCHRLWRKIFK
jgi:hypothetical protein